jgi:hypothetical protein
MESEHVTEINTIDTSFITPEDVKINSFGNIVFYSYLEFRTTDKVHKRSNSACYAPPSEPFRF